MQQLLLTKPNLQVIFGDLNAPSVQVIRKLLNTTNDTSRWETRNLFRLIVQIMMYELTLANKSITTPPP